MRCSYTQAVQTNVELRKLDPKSFWKIANQILDRGKASVSTIINDPEFISSSSDKPNIFASVFASNSILDDIGDPLPDLPISLRTILIILPNSSIQMLYQDLARHDLSFLSKYSSLVLSDQKTFFFKMIRYGNVA